jgi:hypothetical protein
VKQIAGILPGEDDVIRGEGLPVVPSDTPLGIPGHRPAIGAKGAVFATRNRIRQQASEVAVATECRSRRLPGGARRSSIPSPAALAPARRRRIGRRGSQLRSLNTYGMQHYVRRAVPPQPQHRSSQCAMRLITNCRVPEHPQHIFSTSLAQSNSTEFDRKSLDSPPCHLYLFQGY